MRLPGVCIYVYISTHIYLSRRQALYRGTKEKQRARRREEAAGPDGLENNCSASGREKRGQIELMRELKKNKAAMRIYFSFRGRATFGSVRWFGSRRCLLMQTFFMQRSSIEVSAYFRILRRNIYAPLLTV